jgi:NitT/TauT family transport system substrate-binding protein
MLLIIAATAGCSKPAEQSSSQSSGKPGATPVRLGLAQVTLNPIGAWIGKEHGFFAKEGLDTEITAIRGDTQAVQALLAGSSDLVIVGSVAAIAASAEGADVVSLATLGATMPYLLVTSPDIKTPKDLAGKRIGVSGTGLAVSSAAMEIALREFGMDRQRDGIIFLPAGSAGERTMAVTSGGIHATVLSVGQYPRIAKLEKEGKVRILSDLSKLDLRWDHCYLLTTGKYRDSHKDVIDRFLKALLQAHAFILNPANKPAVLASISKNLGYDNESDLNPEQIYEHIPNTVVRKPYSSDEAVQTLVNMLKNEFPNLSKVDVAKLLDKSFLRTLDDSGFIDSLYAGQTTSAPAAPEASAPATH